jgi:rubredoxin
MIRYKCNNCGYEIKTYDRFAGKIMRYDSGGLR